MIFRDLQNDMVSGLNSAMIPDLSCALAKGWF